ncbi:LOW QUALITY PROTEIN: hypothetical protein RJ639_024355 [Escallonia herrerae]|uniref:H(+)-transporting two-sector ATPase n=1 Tax=Escallonia herrerae TaxID=1293975 RepID=A0AA88UZP6_9ASTE|nr:LOW QUALITY PROTEIN: hypothetical protein RJ639_024355 [Escallonia herrerae]
MKINPTTSGSGVSKLEKKLGAYRPNYLSAFLPGKMPNIYNALLRVEIPAGNQLTSLLRYNRVRVLAMSATDGLTRGIEVIDMGASLSVLVGGATLGRIFNYFGSLYTTSRTHRFAPAFVQLDTNYRFSKLELKSFSPYCQGSWSGETRIYYELINNIAKAHVGVSVLGGVSERTREGNDLYVEMKESRVIN